MIRHFAAIRFLVALMFLGIATSAFSSTAVEKLMMPGELSSAHAKLEEDCANCHKVLEKKAQSNLCLACHKEINADVTNKSGFHGHNLVVSKSECYACHAEHLGRDRKIIQLEPAIFNHAETNYPLRGGHAKVDCTSCHVSGKKFRDAPHTCFACHEKTQPHKGNLGNKCETCHVVEDWKKVAAFDHEKTKFPLRGAHVKTSCISCHVGEVYKTVSTTCNDCHAIQDVHGGKFGAKCEDCHNVEKWKDAKFDHGKQTKFALLGAHAKALCADCHGADTTKKVSMVCVDCHKEQDVHKTRLGETCGDCHGVNSWRSDVKFDHGLTSYPLTGLHVAVACESCHSDKTYKGAATNCFACHAKDDKHEGRFASTCESCHSALGWLRITFNHGRDTKYPLTGAHGKIGCYACHTAKNVKSASLPTDCYACHKAQDVHQGKFGTDCAKCHTTDTFKSAFIRQ
jgi:Cytochrome c7 and related cytochrome c